MAAIDVNLDDLQSCIEAGSRATDALHTDTTKSNGSLNPSLLRSMVRHVEDLRACARDQHAAMEELREALTRLRKELNRSASAVGPAPVVRRNQKTLW